MGFLKFIKSLFSKKEVKVASKNIVEKQITDSVTTKEVILEEKTTAKEIKADLKKSKERLGRATRSFYESIPEDMVITRADAIAAGNCVPGVDNWLRRFSLDPSTAYNARGMLSLDPSNQFLKKTILYKMAKLDKKPSIIKKNYLNMIKRIGAV